MIDVESTGATVITTTTTGGESNSAKACAAKVPDLGLRKHKGQHKLPKKETRLEYVTHALTEMFQASATAGDNICDADGNREEGV